MSLKTILSIVAAGLGVVVLLGVGDLDAVKVLAVGLLVAAVAIVAP